MPKLFAFVAGAPSRRVLLLAREVVAASLDLRLNYRQNGDPLIAAAARVDLLAFNRGHLWRLVFTVL